MSGVVGPFHSLSESDRRGLVALVGSGRSVRSAAGELGCHYGHALNFWVLLQLGAGAKKAPFLLCDQRYVPVLSGRLEYPANNHCIRIRVTIGKHRALPLPQ